MSTFPNNNDGLNATPMYSGVSRPSWAPRRDRIVKKRRETILVPDPPAETADRYAPLRTNRFQPHRQPLRERFDEPVWSLQQLEGACRAEGLDEEQVRKMTFILYTDMLLHLNTTYNQERRLRQHEEPAGLIIYPLDDEADDDLQNGWR